MDFCGDHLTTDIAQHRLQQAVESQAFTSLAETFSLKSIVLSLGLVIHTSGLTWPTGLLGNDLVGHPALE